MDLSSISESPHLRVPTSMKRPASKILSDLISELEKIVVIVKKDTGGQWLHHFEDFLGQALEIKREGSNEEAVRDFCSSLRSMFQGKSPFAEYSPRTFDDKTGRYAVIPGTEDYDLLKKNLQFVRRNSNHWIILNQTSSLCSLYFMTAIICWDSM